MASRHPLGVVAKVIGLLTCLVLFVEGLIGSYVLIPLAVLLAIPVAILWRLDRPKVPPGHCTTCGYNLTGNESGRCPECGDPIETGVDDIDTPTGTDA